MGDAMTMLETQIKELIDVPVSGEPTPYLDRVERTLTDGYAQALQLEAERWRLERRLGEVAATMTDGDANGKAVEISGLASRLSSADGELVRLRGMLAMLRRRADAVRAAA